MRRWPRPRRSPAADEGALIAAARARATSRSGRRNSRASSASRTGWRRRILREPSGEALAAACKGAHLKRATFSALAVLFAPESAEKERRLGAYDAVPQDGAESLVQFWRAHPHLGQDENGSEAA